MFDYLQQFNKLPKNLRDQVSSPLAMASISELETKYKIDLAIVVMKVMVKSLSLANLPFYLSEEFSLSADTAQQLVRDLKEKIFASSAEYLGLTREITAFDQDKEIENIIVEAGLIFPSSMAVSRFKNIISTYNRGIRNKIDTKNTLAKSTKIGGLDLSPEEIARVLKICDSRLPKDSITASSISFFAPAAVPSARLDKIVASADSSKIGAEYNLKQAIASGQIKNIVVPVEKLDLPLPKKELDLPLLKKELDLPLPGTVKETVVTQKIPTERKAISENIIPTEKVNSAPLPPRPIPPVVHPAISPIIPPVVHPAISQIKPAPGVQMSKLVSPETIAKSAPLPLRPVAASRPVQVPTSSKPVMHDIKPMPKIMGPLEELQFLDLLNFRRLGKLPAEITGKIFSKIKLLEAEGYDKMILGVRAWRQSPVNRLYLKMGQEAMNKGLTIKDFAAAAEKDNGNYLKLEEIEAIIALNSKLVF